MLDYFFFILFVVIVFIVWGISIYNKFIKYLNMIEEGWSIIDVVLK